jgi:hypothetical protein
MLSLCCRPNRPNALSACVGLLPFELRAVRERTGKTGETWDFFALPSSSVLLVSVLCSLCDSLCTLPPSVLLTSKLSLSFFHALNCRSLPTIFDLSALSSHCSFLPVISHSCHRPLPCHRPPLPKSCISGSCTGCSRPHVDYAISIVSAPYRVSESFCVSRLRSQHSHDISSCLIRHYCLHRLHRLHSRLLPARHRLIASQPVYTITVLIRQSQQHHLCSALNSACKRILQSWPTTIRTP